MEKRGWIFSGGASWLLAALLLGGCRGMVLLDPKGPVGEAERTLILAAVALMSIVVIPVFVLCSWFARKYRASNPDATYRPKWSYSVGIDLAIWLVPVAIIIVLGTLAWRQTHRLDPFRPLDVPGEPIRIEAVSMNWKWLFIYPDHGIATVNRVAFPANAPLRFKITSDTVLSSFFIPQLGSQVYGMAGRETRLHLLADEPGVYRGQNQQFSGRGYPEMHFQAVAMPRDRFESWVAEVRRAPDRLDLDRFRELQEPDVMEVTLFSSVVPGLFDHIIATHRPRSTAAAARGAYDSRPGEAGAREAR